jgi:sialic acid synthase SpsE
MLEDLDTSAYKVPSGEVTNIPYLERLAKTDKPVILSSGMSSLSEIERAVSVLRQRDDRIVLMQCTSKYPCPHEEVGLNVLELFRKRFDLPVGLSDHTLTIYTSIAAVVLGASVIERHFTISKELYGPDAEFSLEPDEFRSMVEGIRAVETALNSPVDKDNIEQFKQMRETFQKSIVSTTDIPKGTAIEPGMISVKKPGTGLEPEYFAEIIGKVTTRHIPKDSLLQRGDIKWH